MKNFLRNLYNGFLSYNGFITDFWVFERFCTILVHDFQGVIENLDAGRRGGCFKDIKMRLVPRCSRL
jgi:hypothetical protein